MDPVIFQLAAVASQRSLHAHSPPNKVALHILYIDVYYASPVPTPVADLSVSVYYFILQLVLACARARVCVRACGSNVYIDYTIGP